MEFGRRSGTVKLLIKVSQPKHTKTSLQYLQKVTTKSTNRNCKDHKLPTKLRFEGVTVRKN